MARPNLQSEHDGRGRERSRARERGGRTIAETAAAAADVWMASEAAAADAPCAQAFSALVSGKLVGIWHWLVAISVGRGTWRRRARTFMTCDEGCSNKELLSRDRILHALRLLDARNSAIGVPTLH